MSAKQWPATLRPSRVAVDIEGQSKSGGISAEGFEQPVVGSAGRITVKLEFYVQGGVVSNNTLLAARAMKAHLRGRANTVYAPLIDLGNSPAAMAGEAYGPFNISHSDGALFSDDSGYEQYATPAHVGSTEVLGAGSITIVMDGGHSPQPGQWFGLKGKEAYLIDTATDQGSDTWLLTFSPTLRRATVIGELVDFENPYVECRMATDTSFAIELQPPMYGTPTLELVEAPP